MDSIGSTWTAWRPRGSSSRVPLVVVVMGLAALTLACESAREAASPTTTPARTESSDHTPPDELADGSSLPELPSAVTAAFERPIVGADSVGPDHPLAEACLDREQQDASPAPFEGTPTGAYLSPFGGSVQFETTARTGGEDSGRAMITCDVLWRSGEPRPGPGAVHPWSDDDALRTAGGALSYAEGVAFLSVPVPEPAAWLVHDRDDHLIAYPVADGLPVRVSTPVASTEDTLTISVVYLDDEGKRIDAEEVTGAVAG